MSVLTDWDGKSEETEATWGESTSTREEAPVEVVDSMVGGGGARLDRGMLASQASCDGDVSHVATLTPVFLLVFIQRQPKKKSISFMYGLVSLPPQRIV